jgi:hypothetical protein
MKAMSECAPLYESLARAQCVREQTLPLGEEGSVESVAGSPRYLSSGGGSGSGFSAAESINKDPLLRLQSKSGNGLWAQVRETL